MTALTISNPQQTFFGIISTILFGESQTTAAHPVLDSAYGKRWIASGLDKDMLLAEPLCVEKMVQLNLHRVFRTWEGILRKSPTDGQMELRVKGVWQKAYPFLSQLKANWDGWESVDTPGNYWCCTGFGFENRSLSDWTRLPPCAQLSADQLKYAQEMARKLPSPNAKGDESCILEIISGNEFPEDELSPMSGIKDIYMSPQHPMIRLIDDKGEVKGNGFWPSEPFEMSKLFFNFQGRFRSPDTYECVSFHKRYVTRIAISKKQYHDLVSECEKLQKEGKFFNITHNCTAFVANILHKVGFTVDSRVNLIDFLAHCSPLLVQKILFPITFILSRIGRVAHKVFTSFIYNPLMALAKKVQDQFPQIFGSVKQTPPDKVPFVGCNANDMIRYPLPKKIVEWQQEQLSTGVYPRNTSFYGQYRATPATS